MNRHLGWLLALLAVLTVARGAAENDSTAPGMWNSALINNKGPYSGPPPTPTLEMITDPIKTSVTAFVDVGNGTLEQRPTPATLYTYKPSDPEAPPDFTLVIDADKQINGCLIEPTVLPIEYRGLFPEGTPLLYRIDNQFSLEGIQVHLYLSKDELAKETATLTLLDGFGRPLAGARVALQMDPTRWETQWGFGGTPEDYYETTSDADGHVAYPIPIKATSWRQDGPVLPKIDPNSYGSGTYRLVITDPSTGQRLYIQDFVRNPFPLSEDESNAWCLPFVVGDTPEDSIQFLGRVVDAEGNGVEAAYVELASILFSGGGRYRLGYGTRVTTSSDGRFTITIPQHIFEKELDREDFIPIAAGELKVVPPENWRSMAAVVPPFLRSGEAVEIPLQDAEIVVCGLYDAAGEPIADTQQGSGGPVPRLVQIDEKGKQGKSISGARISKAGDSLTRVEFRNVILPGDFQLCFGTEEYETRHLTREEIAAPIIWRKPEQPGIVFEGRVVDGRNAAPLAGAYVVMSRRPVAWMFPGGMKQADFDALFADARVGGVAIEAERPSVPLPNGSPWKWDDVLAIARTGGDGDFRVVCAPGGKATDIVVVMPDFIGEASDIGRLASAPTKRGYATVYTFPDVALKPAAHVRFNILPASEWDQALIDTVDKMRESDSLLCAFSSGVRSIPPKGVPAPREWYDILPLSVRIGRDGGVIDLPAGALSITLHGRIELGKDAPKGYGSAMWHIDEPLAQGQEITLDTKMPELMTPIMIQVRHADGTPAPKTLVFMMTHGKTESVYTDAAGTGMCYADDDEIIDLWIPGEDKERLVDMRDVRIPKSEEPYVLELTLPDPAQ